MKTTLTVLLICLIALPSKGMVMVFQTTNATPVFHSLAVEAYERDHPQPKYALCIVGVLVVVVGGVVIYRLVNFCKTHFPPPPGTNNVLTNHPGTNMPGTNTTITSWLVPAEEQDHLWSDPLCPDCACTFIIKYTITGTNLEIGSCNFWRADDGWTLPQLSEHAQTAYGITITPGVGQQFTSNGLAVPAIPYTVTFTNGVAAVVDDGPSNTVVVERKTASGWMPVVTNIWSAKLTNCYTMDVNAPCSMAFYRAVLK